MEVMARAAKTTGCVVPTLKITKLDDIANIIRNTQENYIEFKVFVTIAVAFEV